jgi:hypothetical protein
MPRLPAVASGYWGAAVIVQLQGAFAVVSGGHTQIRTLLKPPNSGFGRVPRRSRLRLAASIPSRESHTASDAAFALCAADAALLFVAADAAFESCRRRPGAHSFDRRRGQDFGLFLPAISVQKSPASFRRPARARRDPRLCAFLAARPDHRRVKRLRTAGAKTIYRETASGAESRVKLLRLAQR